MWPAPLALRRASQEISSIHSLNNYWLTLLKFRVLIVLFARPVFLGFRNSARAWPVQPILVNSFAKCIHTAGHPFMLLLHLICLINEFFSSSSPGLLYIFPRRYLGGWNPTSGLKLGSVMLPAAEARPHGQVALIRWPTVDPSHKGCCSWSFIFTHRLSACLWLLFPVYAFLNATCSTSAPPSQPLLKRAGSEAECHFSSFQNKVM